MKPNVIDEIVKNDLCIGCGTCAGICPQKILKIQDNEYGEYIPYEVQVCDSRCGLCLEVCPFNNNENETQMGAKIYGSTEGMKYLPETGYYLDSYVGYSNEFRQSSASGGMATWLLAKLLKEGIVDYVICPTPQKNPDKLFSFEITSDENSVKAASGSVYYPVEMSEVIQKIIEVPGRYAVTGLPCFIKALRLASQKNRKLRERIVFTIGLVCGQMKSKNYTKYIAALAGNKDLNKIQNVYYRGKSPEKPASNFYFQSTDEHGSQHKIFWNEGVSEAWVNRWFTPNACNYCDDVFAELADVTLMDAWLPEYSRDSRGTNLIITRSSFIDKLLSNEIKNEKINIQEIPIRKVIQSQIGVIDIKRTQLSYRLHLAEKNGLSVPEKRVKAVNDIGIFKKKEVRVKSKAQKESKEIFIVNYKNDGLDIKSFRNEMYPHIKKCRTLGRIRTLMLPIRMIKKMKNKLKEGL
ncbi:Coenzyme F420 hydrogenase/dehydrogenase, beta subunit C-terminal domain [Methanosarcina mazei]|uniref:4Fe-4S ferredoxin n=1 Tax=Methanosarcina mazei TaxID=2209 RepID=A0A0F8CSM1_METMZ|nr:Coenzyme F420 hydrogenase/dehydrogenase, beta subunit C-terminal domain [Methanosarcina mazei]KKG07949.1 4Fe-4S ferredoxin [Methanosarcina mazei]